MLPLIETGEELEAVARDEALLRPAVADLCERLGLAGKRMVRFDEGSLPVYAIGDAHVVKLYPSFDREECVREERVLSYLYGELPVPTPQLHSAGAYKNGWNYVLMSRLPGESLAEEWPRIPAADQDRLVTEAAEALAALHALNPAPLRTAVGPADWSMLVNAQRARAVEQQQEVGLPEQWLEQIPWFLDTVPLPPPTRRVLLHTEFMRQHLLVSPDGRRLTGLFDFEPAMIGDPAYDFVGVGLFVTCGDPRLLKRFYEAYGRSPFDPRTLMAYTLLHVYSNLTWYLRELPAPPKPTLEALAETWFSAG
ncbi:aminoglycoside phosphotransferase family protein [Streptomyces montanus]|uniref:Aminoglycoside phosphotransferase family protein n=1 Tax=Streptomyces montanus TaxID=2580423 RepID=A0A5R9FR53_9ACTN|nr:aminoglycoside phosphotransferase family protein [Streptomyces montanus]TLS42045.1 aminoglycoside phosphotransferase family protein [Streptomyces montanus]